MPKRFSGLTTADQTLVTTTELVVATVVVPSVRGPGIKIQLHGKAQVTTGTNTTALTGRWRRGTAITDTLIGEANATQVATAAGGTEDVEHDVEDTPGEVANQSYVFTIQQTAASANGSVLQVEAWADVDL